MIQTRRRLFSFGLEHVGVMVVFAALTAGLTWPWVLHFDSHTADVGVDDPLLYARMLRHFLAWLEGQRTGLFDIDFFWPHPEALTTTDVSLGILYGALPFLPWTEDLLTLVNLSFFVTFVLTGHATYIFSKELTQNRWAAVLGASAFTFCMYRFHQLDHLHVLNMQWGVYALYAWAVMQRHPSFVPTLGFSVALFLHATASMNIAVYSAFAFLMFGVFLWVGTPAEKRLSFTRWTLAGGAVTAFVLLPVYLPYLQARERTGMKRALGEILSYSGRIEQLAAAPRSNALYGAQQSHLMGSESLTFSGITILLLAAVAVWFAIQSLQKEGHPFRGLAISTAVLGLTGVVGFAGLFHRVAALLWVFVLLVGGLYWARKQRRTASWTAVLLAVGFFYLYASLGPQLRWRDDVYGAGLWEGFSQLPGFSWVRTPARFYFETSFALAILAALGTSLCLKRFRHAWQRNAFATLEVVGVLFEFNSAPMPLRKMRTLQEAPPVYSWLAQQPGNGAVLELPALHLFERYRMYFSTLHNRPTVNAESGYSPAVMEWMSMQSFASYQAVNHLRRLRSADLEFVVLHEDQAGRFSPRMKDVLAQAGGTPVIRFGSDEVWRMPTVASKKAFSPENIDATIQDVLPTLQGLEVKWNMSVKGQEGVFEYRNTKLRLQLKEDKKVHTFAHFAPPLFAPGLTDSFSATLPLKGRRPPSPCTVELLDEKGGVWASFRYVR